MVQRAGGDRGFRVTSGSRRTTGRVARIFVNSVKNGEKFQCRQQIVIKLNHDTGDIRYFLSRRKCRDLGPA